MRTQRKFSVADIYHVVSRGAGRQLIFESDADRSHFLGILAASLQETDAHLYAWCLMGNHFHLLVHAPIENLSMLMRRVCGSYAQWFNKKTGRVGHLFQDRFHSEPVNDESYLLTVVRYIHNNPQVAGIDAADRYAWSSYREYCGSPGLCKTDLVLDILGGRIGFIDFHKQDCSSDRCLETDLPRTSTRPILEEQAIATANSILNGIPLSKLKTLPVKERNEKLRLLKEHGLSVRQIERFTGIGRNTVARA